MVDHKAGAKNPYELDVVFARSEKTGKFLLFVESDRAIWDDDIYFSLNTNNQLVMHSEDQKSIFKESAPLPPDILNYVLNNETAMTFLDDNGLFVAESMLPVMKDIDVLVASKVIKPSKIAYKFS